MLARGLLMLALAVAGCRTAPLSWDPPDLASALPAPADLSPQAGSPSAVDLAAPNDLAIAFDMARPFWWENEGDTWSSAYQFIGVWANAADDVYVVGSFNAAAAIFHSRGDGIWTTQYSSPGYGSIVAIWGASAHDLYAVGLVPSAGEGTVFYSTGDGNWSATPVGGQLDSVWGSGPRDIYVTDYYGRILHSTGDGNWSVQNSSGYQYGPVSGSSAKAVYVSGFPARLFSTGDGNWSALGGTCFPTWAASDDEVYGYDVTNPASPSLCHRRADGQWYPEASQYVGGVIWGSSANDIFNGGGGTLPGGDVQWGVLMHSTGDGNWTTLIDAAHQYPVFTGVGGSSPNDVYAVGGAVILHGHR